MSLAELKLMSQLESRQKNVNKKLQNIVKEETTKKADEPYLLETEGQDIAHLKLPSFEKLKENLSEPQINEIIQYVQNVIMPQVEEEMRMNILDKVKHTLPIYISQFPDEQEFTYPVPLISEEEKNLYLDKADPRDRKEIARHIFIENNERIFIKYFKRRIY